jgi:hypothetical protein
MCSYRERKPDPTEMMQLDGFTVDYCEPVPGKYGLTNIFVYPSEAILLIIMNFELLMALHVYCVLLLSVVVSYDYFWLHPMGRLVFVYTCMWKIS